MRQKLVAFLSIFCYFIFWEESVVNWAQHNSFFLGLTDIALIFDQMPTFQTAIHFVLKSSLIVRASCWLKLTLDLLFQENKLRTAFQILLKLSPCKNFPKISQHIFYHTVINSTCNTWVGPKTGPCGTPHSLLIFETCSHKLTNKLHNFYFQVMIRLRALKWYTMWWYNLLQHLGSKSQISLRYSFDF